MFCHHLNIWGLILGTVKCTISADDAFSAFCLLLLFLEHY